MVGWIQAVIDIPADRFGEGAEFWRAASGSTFGDIHPDHDEYVHLVPPTGDMHLELQRLDDGRGKPGIHLDLLVDDIEAEVERAEALGARLLAKPGHAVLASPAGVTFCLVPHSHEHASAPAISSPAAHAVDQICIDVAASDFDREIDFWSRLTQWPARPRTVGEFEEFETFERPASMPIGLLVQRLGADDFGYHLGQNFFLERPQTPALQ